MTSPALRAPAPPGTALRFPALLWALLHVPLILALYGAALGDTLGMLPGRYRLAVAPLYLVEAVAIAAVPWALTLPASLAPRAYRWLAPAASALALAVLVVDAGIYRALHFHVNGLVLRVLVQPNALREIGLAPEEVAAVVAVMAVWVALATWGGARFLRRFARARRVWPTVVALVLLQAADRVSVAVLNFAGGPALFAAGQVLPLQVRFTMSRTLARWTGRPRMRDPLEVAATRSALRLPAGASPESIHLTARHDVVVALIESVRSDFLDSLTMPNLWRRAEAGARFTRHYTAATSTHYSVFSLFYGLQSHKLEAVVGAGRPPLLFGALQANGYRLRLIAASSVDWMGLKRTVFGAVERDLEADIEGRDGSTRDSVMLAHARRWVATADTTPLFLFLFFDGPHFNYTFPPDAARFAPYWDGRGSIEASRVAPALLERRARNAAWEVDRKLEAFLTWFAARRGRAPLLLATGDHGEEYREHGRVGHGSEVTEEQVHVPMVWSGPGVPHGAREVVTSSVDLLPTLFGLLGDTTEVAAYSDGVRMFDAPVGRFVLSSVGWEPRFAVIGHDLKVSFTTYDAGMGSVRVTDPWDHPLPDGDRRFAAAAGGILRAFAPRVWTGHQR